MGWKIVEVETDEYLKLYLNNILIERPLGKIMINIPDIDLLIIHNDRAKLSIKLMNHLTRCNVSVIFMNAIHEPSSYLIPINGHHKSLKILEKQINWSNRYKGKVWQEIVQNKICNQKILLSKIKHVDDSIVDSLGTFKECVKSFDITNREGHAAKVYWNALFGLSFIRDQKSQKFPVINSMLNYGYAIIRSLMISSIIKRGLDTRITFFHKSFSNFFALASDLMEPFRQLVDQVVFEFKDRTHFSLDIREKMIGLVEKKVNIKGKKHNLSSAMTMAVESIINDKGWEWVDLWD